MMREQTPEMYEALVRNFDANAATGRDLQTRALAVDEKQIPRIVTNDRIALITSPAVVLALVAAGIYLAVQNVPLGPYIALVAACAPVATALAKVFRR